MISLKDLKHTLMYIYIYMYIYDARTPQLEPRHPILFLPCPSKRRHQAVPLYIYVYDYMYVHMYIYIHRLCVCASICACIMDHEDLATSIFACVYIYMVTSPMTRTSCRTMLISLSNQFKWKCSFLIFKSCLIKQ